MDRKIIEASHESTVHGKITHLSFFKCPRRGDPALTFNKLCNELLRKSCVPKSALFSVHYDNSNGVQVSITELEQLQHALDGQGSTPLKFRVIAHCSNFAMVTIMHADSFLRIPMSSSGVLFYESLHVRARDHFRIPSCKFEFIQADPEHPAEQHSNIAHDYNLKRVAKLIRQKDGTKDNLQLATKVIEGGNGINNSSLIVQTPPYIVKVMHKGMCYRLTVARGKLEFSLEELRCRIHDLLNLPLSPQFMLQYVDAHQERITMTEDYDLEDAIVMQSLQPRRVNVLMIEESDYLDGI